MHIVESSLTLAGTHTLEGERSRVAAGGQTFAALLDGTLAALPSIVDSGVSATATPRLPTQDEVMRWALQTLLAALFGPVGGRDCVTASQGEVSDLPARSQPALPTRAVVPRIVCEQWHEEERCEFAASGNVCLADGSERQFSLAWVHERREEGARLTVEAGLRDPLVVDLGPPEARPGETRVRLDLDGDGRLDQFRLPAPGSALLFHDRNGNGRADDGRELFGPRTGNGFAELAQLDRDGNGWIDERDAAFAELRLWSADEKGETSVVALADAGVGALATRAVATPFTFKRGGEIVAQVRAGSVWLGEQGGAGSVRQIDVAVEDDGQAAIV